MRRIISTTACLVAIAVFISALAPAAFAQRVTGEWATVQSLPPGDEVSVKLKDGQSLRGRFSTANDSELTILRKKKQQPIAKNTIAQVYRLERRAEKAKYAAIGAGIGAAAGGTIGGVKAASGSSSDDGIYTLVGLVFGTGFGALGGFLFGAAKRKHVLIYQAP